jgi:hypothetical protein
MSVFALAIAKANHLRQDATQPDALPSRYESADKRALPQWLSTSGHQVHHIL